VNTGQSCGCNVTFAPSTNSTGISTAAEACSVASITSPRHTRYMLPHLKLPIVAAIHAFRDACSPYKQLPHTLICPCNAGQRHSHACNLVASHAHVHSCTNFQERTGATSTRSVQRARGAQGGGRGRPQERPWLQPLQAKRARVCNVAAAAPDAGRYFSTRDKASISQPRPNVAPAREVVHVVRWGLAGGELGGARGGS